LRWRRWGTKAVNFANALISIQQMFIVRERCVTKDHAN
jgi:hypothetical protein